MIKRWVVFIEGIIILRYAESTYDQYHMTKVLLCVTFSYFAIYFSTYSKIKILSTPSCADLQCKQNAASRNENFEFCGYL